MDSPQDSLNLIPAFLFRNKESAEDFWKKNKPLLTIEDLEIGTKFTWGTKICNYIKTENGCYCYESNTKYNLGTKIPSSINVTDLQIIGEEE